MADQIEVSGLTELRQTLLKDLPEALQGKASQLALAKATRPIIAAAQARAPSRKPRGFVGPIAAGAKVAGNLKRAIYSYRNRESTKTYESRFIGVKGKAWYWRFIEFGRASITRATGSLGNVRKGFFGKTVTAVPAKPFLRPAFEENATRALEIYQQALLPAIEKVAKQAYSRSLKRVRKAITGF
jgi:HK97 gp10 family phage protein